MPPSLTPPIAVVAAVQASPFYLNLERSLDRAFELIAEASRRRAQLVVFPEAWLPGYPAWLDTCRDVALWDNQQIKRLYAQLLDNSVAVPGRVTDALAEAARNYNLTLVMGVHERVNEGAGRGTLYNSILTFAPDIGLINVHRKLIPTFNERMIWGQGDGSGLRVVETPVGRVGGLICWEHWMPLARQRLHVAGEDIHVALWPSVKEMHQIASRHYAFEGRCFVVAAGGIMRHSDLPRDLEIAGNFQNDESEFVLNGGSAVIGPDGQYVAGPAFGSEVIILARINLERIREESLTLDVTGHFNRPDLFDFSFKGTACSREDLRVLSQSGIEAARQPQLQPVTEIIMPSASSNTEVLAATGTEVLVPSITDSPPAFRVISSARSSSADTEIHELD